MKKILTVVIGLITLIALSSCDDKFTYDDEKNFLPLAYEAKSPKELTDVSSTLLVLGIKGLVFDEIEKSDWKIITKSRTIFQGSQPLSIDGKIFPLDDSGAVLLEIPTNYDNLPVTFANTRVTYSYMGEEMELDPIDTLQVSVNLEEVAIVYEPAFIERGYIVFTLRVGYVPVQIHKMPFLVIGKGVDPDDVDVGGDQGENESSEKGDK